MRKAIEGLTTITPPMFIYQQLEAINPALEKTSQAVRIKLALVYYSTALDGQEYDVLEATIVAIERSNESGWYRGCVGFGRVV